MDAVGKFLQNEKVVLALITAATSIAVALLGWVSGFWKWVGGEVSKWLAYRQEIGKATPRVPRSTMFFVVGTSVIPALMGEHNSDGRISTDCRGPMRITNLNSFPAVPTRVEVTLCGWERFRRGAYEISLTSPQASRG